MDNITTSIDTARNTKSTRLWFMGLIGVVIFVLWWMKIIKTGFAIGLGIIILAAIGIETMNYDLDLGRLWQTGDIQESRVTHTQDGLKLMGSCIIPKK
jgi:O-antigen ligase